jgi:hypothetical protein
VIPCHRVIGSNGKLVGFGGGLALKERLLALEQRHGSRARPVLPGLFPLSSRHAVTRKNLP